MTPEAVGPLLAMAQATTIHDAHGHAVDAVNAGATSDEVSQAITEWMQLQATQVQQIPAARANVRRCWCGRPVPASSACGCCCAECYHPPKPTDDTDWDGEHCVSCGRETDTDMCHDCDVEASYVGGLAPRYGAEA